VEGFGPGRLADVDGLFIVSFYCGGDTHMSGKPLSDGVLA